MTAPLAVDPTIRTEALRLADLHMVTESEVYRLAIDLIQAKKTLENRVKALAKKIAIGT